jgi:methyl-accepting chemotaxis protein
MNRIMKAIIEEMTEQLTADKLTAILLELVTDIIDGKFSDDADVSMAMTTEEFNDVGAVWRHPELWDTFYQEICAKYVHFTFGDLISAASESAEDVMELAKSSKDVVGEAGRMTKRALALRYPDLPYDVVLAQKLVERHRDAITELLTMVRGVIAEAKEAAEQAEAVEHHPGTAPTATLYQFPGPTTVQ